MGEILGIGVMHHPGLIAEIVDRVETYVFNSSKCFALFPPPAKPMQVRRA
jgi:hypothetical protein